MNWKLILKIFLAVTLPLWAIPFSVVVLLVFLGIMFYEAASDLVDDADLKLKGLRRYRR